jgi:hypothetical protein
MLADDQPRETDMGVRQAILFMIGLVLGAIGTTSISSVLRQRHAYPRGLMQVMQHDIGELRNAARQKRCDAGTNATVLQLRSLAGGIESAVYGNDPSNPPDPPFAEYARRLRAALPTQADCSDLAAAIKPVGEACDACHREYR